jgi:hypothetical protein
MAAGALVLPTNLPVVSVVCGRCRAVVDRMRLDPEDGHVFYEWSSARSRRLRVRWRRTGAGPAGRADGAFPGDRTRYRCGCGFRAERDFEEITDAVQRVFQAGSPHVVLGYDL